MENVLYDYHFNFHYVMPELIAFSSGATVLIAGIILFIKLKNRKHAKIAGIIAMMLSSPIMSMSVFYISTAVHDHVIIKNAIKNGTYESITGYVEELSENNDDGYTVLRFKIDDFNIRIVGSPGQSGYDTMPSKGGVINQNGQRLTINYVMIFREVIPNTHYAGEKEYTTAIIKITALP